MVINGYKLLEMPKKKCGPRLLLVLVSNTLTIGPGLCSNEIIF